MSAHLTRSMLSAGKRTLQLNNRRTISLASTSRPSALITSRFGLQKACASNQADLADEALAEMSASEAGSSQSQVSTSKTAGESNGATGIDAPFGGTESGVTDWSKSYYGLSVEPFSKEVSEVLLAPINPVYVEVKPGAYLLA